MLRRFLGLGIRIYYRSATTTTTRRTPSKKGSKSEKKVVALTPNCHAKLKEWIGLLKKEIEAVNTSSEELITGEKEYQQYMELRSTYLRGLVKTADDHSPTGYRCVLRIPKSSGTEYNRKPIRPGIPVMLVEEQTMRKVEAVVSDYDEERNLIWVKTRSKNGKRQEVGKDVSYSLLNSTSYGNYHSLIEYLQKREKNRHNVYPGDQIMSIAYRDSPVRLNFHDLVPHILSDCDESQVRAVAAAVNKTRPFVCIQGPPGTGKTKVVAEIIYQLVRKKQKVLVCAPSHAAVDNALDRVQDESHVVRLRSEFEADFEEELSRSPKYLELMAMYDDLDQLDKQKEKDELKKRANRTLHALKKEVLSTKSVIFCTVSSKMTWLLCSFGWEPNVVIIDEAAQCIEPSCWVPILNTSRVILVGDHQQLPPLVFSQEGRDYGLDVSLMERLANQFKNCDMNFLLTKQYRMNKDIMEWSNQNFYEDRLEAAEANRNINISEICSLPDSNPLTSPLLLLNTSDLHTLEQRQLNHSVSNKGEADALIDYVKKLMKTGVNPSDIGVISSYYDQVLLLQKSLKALGITVSTVDSFQGQEREIIIFSMVRCNRKGYLGFLKDYRRMNVAVTRAKRQFILIGNARMLSKDTLLNSLKATIQRLGHIINAKQLMQCDNLLDFKLDAGSWKTNNVSSTDCAQKLK